MPLQYPAYVSRIEGHIRSPLAKAAMPVDGSDPLIEKLALGLVLLGVLSLDLKDQHRAARQQDQEVGAVFLHDSLVDVHDLVAEVVVFGPRGDPLVPLQLERLGGLPSQGQRG